MKRMLCCMLHDAESLKGLRTCKSPMFLKITVRRLLCKRLSDRWVINMYRASIMSQVYEGHKEA